MKVRVGSVFSADQFYGSDDRLVGLLQKLGFLGVEMEAAGLYGLAMQEKFQALAVLTASDDIINERKVSAEQRQSGPREAIKIVLDALLTNGPT